MTLIDPSQRCTCKRPMRSGSFYLTREKCRSCDAFVVLSRSERKQLEEAELAALTRSGSMWPSHPNGTEAV